MGRKKMHCEEGNQRASCGEVVGDCRLGGENSREPKRKRERENIYVVVVMRNHREEKVQLQKDKGNGCRQGKGDLA